MENRRNKNKILIPIEEIQKEKTERIWKQTEEQFKECLGKKTLEECYSEQLRKENEQTIIKANATLKEILELDFSKSSSDSSQQILNESSSDRVLFIEGNEGNEGNESRVFNSSSNLLDSTMDSSRSILKSDYYDIVCDENESGKYDLNFIDIDDEHKFFIYYYEDMKTCHSLIMGTKFGKEKENKRKTINAKKDPKTRISFCSKDLNNYPGEKEGTFKCSPEHLCRNCLKINQENYGLPRHYLINSIGRVCKIYKNKDGKACFECYGHFKEKGEKGEINICNHNYTCASCKLMNENYSYYFDEGAIKKILSAK